MPASNLILRELNVSDEVSLKEAIHEFSLSEPKFEFAIKYTPETNLEEYVQLLLDQSKSLNLPEGNVPHSFLLATVNNEIVGRVSIRHKLNDYLRIINGHIGYGVLPSHRKKGYAKEILRQALAICKSLGLEKAMLTCDDDNLGSIKTIEFHGGVLEEKFLIEGSNSLKRSTG